MCEFCNYSHSPDGGILGKDIKINKCANKTDLTDCIIMRSQDENPSMVIFSHGIAKGYFDITYCPKCGERLGEVTEMDKLETQKYVQGLQKENEKLKNDLEESRIRVKELEEIIKRHNFKDTKEILSENEELKVALERKETEINQIDDILNELFGVVHNIAESPKEFKEILREKVDNYKTVADVIPAEPIKVADMLINAEGEYERNSIGKSIFGTDKGRYNLFDVSELRQIAEHLLVYCNHNREGKEG